jgi:hypothetical protein
MAPPVCAWRMASRPPRSRRPAAVRMASAAAAPLYEVEAVVGARGRGRQRELRVRWAGWQGQPDELTWEPAASVQRQVPDAVERFLRAARPHKRQQQAQGGSVSAGGRRRRRVATRGHGAPRQEGVVAAKRKRTDGPTTASANTARHLRSTSSYRGVHWDQSSGKWTAKIQHEGRRQSLGSFADEADAARAHDARARELHGAAARLNFPRADERQGVAWQPVDVQARAGYLGFVSCRVSVFVRF